MPKSSYYRSGVLVIGGGAAGLSLALRLADEGQRCTILAKKELTEGASLYAQGGIAAVLDARDSFASHIEDTHSAGAGLCHADSVQLVVNNAPRNIEWLRERGVNFSEDARSSTGLHLTREGGHSERRVIHAADTTGREVETTLEQLVRRHENINILEYFIAIDLITSRKLSIEEPNRCYGVYAYDIRNRKVITIQARTVAVATGGASKVYLYTSNPDTSTGDGIAMAWRAGCRVANMEFVQFHPTCLYHPQAKSFLISEALRGEGARLVMENGDRFMARHDERMELAPRDIVARAIDFEMKKHGADSVFLDISHKPADKIKQHFPNIYRQCLTFGIDITTQRIPVVPAAHYTCGGIVTDHNGSTDIDGLFALGECAFTGLHGANRLASNSLLECLVFAERAAGHILKQRKSPGLSRTLPPWDESRVTDSDEQIVVSHNWEELRHFMWDYVGIVRTTKRLQRAVNRLRLLDEEIREFYSNFRINSDLVELRNLVVVAELIVRSAQQRKESRGLHYILNFPDKLPDLEASDTVLVPDESES